MTTNTVYPSMIVRVCCPNCGAQGRVKRKALLNNELTVLCWKCKGSSLIKTNRRSSYRKKVSIPVAFSVFDIARRDDNRALKGTTVDISRHGMAVQSHRHTDSPNYYREGAMFTFLFTLPTIIDPKKIQGQITRVTRDERGDDCTIGVKFTKLHRFTENAIRFFLSL